MERPGPLDKRSTAQIESWGGTRRPAVQRSGAPWPAAWSSPELLTQALWSTKTLTVCSRRERRSRRTHSQPSRGRGTPLTRRPTVAPLPTPSELAWTALESTNSHRRKSKREREREMRRTHRREQGRRRRLRRYSCCARSWSKMRGE